MPLYEYECPTCGVFEAKRPSAECGEPAPCPNCSEMAPRAFVSPPTLRTDTNNPYTRWGGFVQGDMSTRSSAERTMREQGLVLADGHDCETMERKARGRERELDAKVERHKAEYARLPKDVLKKDAEIAWREAGMAARRAPKAAPMTVEA